MLSRVPLPNGIDLAYQDVGDGPAIVLIHGHPLDHTMWQPQVESLAPNYRVIVPELRGYGITPLPAGKQITLLDDFAEDILALADCLNIDRFVIVGLSLGGQIALETWRQASHRIRALVLADTFASPDTPIPVGSLLKPFIALAYGQAHGGVFPTIVLVAGWLFPGAGHLVMGKWIRGLLLMVSILAMFAIGIALQGKVYTFNTGEPLDMLGFAGDLGTGILYLVARLVGWGQAPVLIAVADYGTKFIVVAGMLNVVAAIDAHSLASGRKAL